MANNQLFVFALAFACFLGPAACSTLVGTVALRLYSKDGSYVKVNAQDAAQLVPKLDLNKKVLLHCHGYQQSADKENVVQLIQSFLSTGNYNVLAADYRHVTDKDYVSAVILAHEVSDILADSIKKLIAAGVNPKQTICTGHSLGAQICGETGRKLPVKISEINGIDPAGPFFFIIQQSLSARDADCVKCMHTDAGFYGTAHACGHIDYYPNGGSREQPGCKVFSFHDLTNSCSHSRSEDYMSESVRNPSAFLSIKCKSWDDFKARKCNNSAIIPMGLTAPCSAQGKFFLQTRSTSPFGKGFAGTVYSG